MLTRLSLCAGRRPVLTVTDPELIRQLGLKSFMAFHDRPEPLVQVRWQPLGPPPLLAQA